MARSILGGVWKRTAYEGGSVTVTIQQSPDHDAVHRWVDAEFDKIDPPPAWYSTKITLTATRDGALIGAAIGTCVAGVAHLGELMVGEGERNGGVGAQLLAAFEGWGRQQGAHLCTLNTNGDRPAARFYARHGWRVFYTIEDHYHHHPTLLMGKELSPQA